MALVSRITYLSGIAVTFYLEEPYPYRRIWRSE